MTMKWVCSSRASWGPRSSPWPSSRPSGGSWASSCLSSSPGVPTNLSSRCLCKTRIFFLLCNSGLPDHHCFMLLAVLALLLHVPGDFPLKWDWHKKFRWTPWSARSWRLKRSTQWSFSGTALMTSRQVRSWTFLKDGLLTWKLHFRTSLIWP